MKNIKTFKLFETVWSKEMEVSDDVKALSNEGLLSILQDHDHIQIVGDETREELEQILQLNLDDGQIDEIEVITVLSAE